MPTAEQLREKLQGKPGAAKKFTDAENAERNRARNRSARRKQTKAGQDIGTIPAVVNWERRLACRHNAALFAKTYLAAEFQKPLSPDHYTAFGKGQQAAIYGGLFVQAAPRGDGKSSRAKAISLWAALYGHRLFELLVGGTSPAAEELLNGVRYYVSSAGMIVRNDEEEYEGFEPGLFPLLFEDFPEITYPVLSLEGESKRQGGQRCGDAKTGIHWGGNHVVFPTVPPGNWIDGKTIGKAPGAGAMIYTTGITGRLRGFNVNGRRPDFVLPDDVSTDESAASPAGNAKIERILASAIIGLAGPGKKIAGLMSGSVIAQGDAFDNILSHEKHPEWDSSRTKMVYSFPIRLERDAKNPTEPSWEEYRDIRFNYNPRGAEGDKGRAAEEATLYYLRNVDKLQEGGVVSWPERFNDDDLDALQHAMNFYFQDKRAFFAEYQNDPLPPDLGDIKELTADQIAGKLSNVERGKAPLDTDTLTAFIDIQQNMLFYCVCGWRASTFTGYVIDYNTFPRQARPYFTKADASPTLAQVTGKPGVEAQIYAGLETLVAAMLTAEWPREGPGATTAKIDRLLIDSGFWSEVVYQFCRRSPYSGVILPSKGQYVGPRNKAIAEGKPKPGDKHGLNWILPLAKESRGLKLLLYDTNFWKSQIMERLAVPIGSGGCLSLFGKEAGAHRLFADHLTAEYRIIEKYKADKSDKFNEVPIWKVKPSHQDNDFFDCLTGCAVAASVQGVSLAEVLAPKGLKATAKPVSYAEQFRRAQQTQGR